MNILVIPKVASSTITIDGLAVEARFTHFDASIEALRYDSEALRGSIQRSHGAEVFTDPAVVAPYIQAWHSVVLASIDAAAVEAAALPARHQAKLEAAERDRQEYLANEAKLAPGSITVQP